MKDIYVKTLEENRKIKEIINEINQGINPIIYGLNEDALAFLAAFIKSKENKKVLIITYDDIRGSKINSKIKAFTEEAFHLKSKQFILYGIEALSRDDMYSRINVMEQAVKDKNGVFVASQKAVTDRVMKKERFKRYSLKINYDTLINQEELSKNLILMGYKRVSQVEGKGQFSLRGGIIDVFSPWQENPYRIELFGDEVDSIRTFDYRSQRSIENIDECLLIPCCEILLDDEEISITKNNIKEDYEVSMENISNRETEDNLNNLFSVMMESLDNRDYIDNAEFFSPYTPLEYSNFLDYFDENTIVFFDEPNRITEEDKIRELEFNEKYIDLYEKGKVLTKHRDIFINHTNIFNTIKKELRYIVYNSILKNNKDFKENEKIHFESKEVRSYYGNLGELAEDINNYKKKGYRIVVTISSLEKGIKLFDDLKTLDCQVGVSGKGDTKVLTSHGLITRGYVEKGFEFPLEKFILLTEKEIFGRIKKKKSKKRKSKGSKIETFTDLNVGDYVVHEHHGIGKYIGIEKIEVKEITKDYLTIEYRGNDKLFVPVDQMDLVQKYIGSDSEKPRINKMGGSEWIKKKAKAQKAIEDMTDELLELYAKRKSIEGYAFSEDSEWQKEFEEEFPYEETDDQLRCVEEIKEDMESKTPMDRLLCGDVGFGKTEVAIRSIFKAVFEGKQAAVLVPTTILAQQHYSNMIERFRNYPITIEMLSRFRTKNQQKEILKKLKSGLVDVVIGTHRLLSKDVKYKDLGLLVVDEEQRFGVKHKEKIKEIKTNVDVLTLTATPIPRTLHMSLIGIRDMSVIEEPPGERLPIQTFVLENNPGFIREALTKELSRGGQVYYVHNRVHDIHKKASKIQALVPEAKIAVAHGQMNEHELENIMIDFINSKYDILVCTTIIETGMDIKNVNTMIIDEADKFGLSQLYQLRGRIGRSSRTSFAYLTYERDKVLSEIAEKRLKAVKEFTEFGSGFKIAMRDLELRGAGNLLGAQQHGHMTAIGYDLFVKMLERTVKKVKGMKKETYEDTTVTIDLNVDAFIPNYYIVDEEQKIEIYKKISALEEKEDILDVSDEIIDRYGEIPREVNNLLKLSSIKIFASKIGIKEIKQKNNKLHVEFRKDDDLINKTLGEMFKDNKESIEKVTKDYKLIYKIKEDDKSILDNLENVFEKIYNQIANV
jgi:transcription-repair coupling factor (superfamily II helicase)